MRALEPSVERAFESVTDPSATMGYASVKFDGCPNRKENVLSSPDYYEDDEWAERVERFADPGGNSALHAASRSNPRNLPCPTCGAENVLTPADRRKGYQCDRCADMAEGKIWPC